jgi:hypothetical protein
MMVAAQVLERATAAELVALSRCISPVYSGWGRSRARPAVVLLPSCYQSVHPDAVVELVTGTTGALVTRVVNFELEAAFVSEPFTAPSLQVMARFY